MGKKAAKALTRTSAAAHLIRQTPGLPGRTVFRTCPATLRCFTLLEIMVMLVIVGVMLAMFTLSMGSFGEDEEREHVRRFAALLELAAEEASIQGREIGIRFYQHGYEFAVREALSDADGNLVWTWRPEVDDNFLRPRDLSEDVTIDLELDGNEITLPYAANEKEAYRPHVYLLSSGGLEPPFVVRIRPSFARDGVTLSVSADGAAEWLEDEY